MKHEIPENVTNSAVLYCINEFVRLERDREILKDHWFHGLSIYGLMNKYQISDTAVKKVLYGIGDRVLIMAAKLNQH